METTRALNASKPDNASPASPAASTASLQIDRFSLGDWQTNCYVAHLPGASECVIFDVGFEPDEMLDWIAARNLKPAAILLTHAHIDHIGGVDQALSRFGPIPLAIHEAEIEFCGDPLLNLSALLGWNVTCARPNVALKHGGAASFGGMSFRVLHTPGHSPGGVAYVHDASKQAVVGDTLFKDSIGRHDFPTSDVKALRRSVRETLMQLPDEMKIYPGHIEPTTIGRERRMNPYVVQGF